MLAAVVQALAADLGELTTPIEARRCEWVGRGGVHLPVHLGRGAIGSRSAVDEESLVIARP